MSGAVNVLPCTISMDPKKYSGARLAGLSSIPIGKELVRCKVCPWLCLAAFEPQSQISCREQRSFRHALRFEFRQHVRMGLGAEPDTDMDMENNHEDPLLRSWP